MDDRNDGLYPRFAGLIRNGLAAIEEGVYVIVGLLLLVAAILVLAGTVSGLIAAASDHRDAVTTGVTVLDHILLALIVAELLHTLRYVVLRGEIVAQPFLFIGLIAVVRRILVLTAQFERQPLSGRALTNELLELAVLGLLALALALAIYLVRRSTGSVEEREAGTSAAAVAPRAGADG